MTRLLLVSDSPALPASYANVVRWFADAVSPLGFEVAFGSLQHGGLPLAYEFNGRRYPHYGCAPPTRIANAIEAFDPSIVVHVRDPVAMIPRFFPGSYSVKAPAQTKHVIQWCPVQHEVLPWDYVEVLHREADLVMPFTKAGEDRLGNSGLARDRMAWLPLGVSPSFSDPDGPVSTGYGRDGVPLLMSVGLGHQDRKMFPILMRAYREIVQDVDLDWYLHTTAIGAFDLVEHAKMLGVDGHWMFPHQHDPNIGIDEEDLARRYRKASAYVACSTGEGFNMPLTEAAALGRVLVHPDMPNESEVVGDYEGPRLSYATHPIPRITSWEWLPDVSSLAEQLAKVKDLKPDPAAGRRYYERHNWGVVAARFREIVEQRGWT